MVLLDFPVLTECELKCSQGYPGRVAQLHWPSPGAHVLYCLIFVSLDSHR